MVEFSYCLKCYHINTWNSCKVSSQITWSPTETLLLGYCKASRLYNTLLNCSTIAKVHTCSTQWCVCVGGKRRGIYTPRVQSGKHTFLSVMVFYYHSLFIQGSQEKACVNYQTGTFIHSIGMCRMWWFLVVIRSFLHSSLLRTFSCHPSPTILPSSLTSSCNLFLGLPLNPVVPKFIYNTLLGILFSSILWTCPNQHNLFNLIVSVTAHF